jgi:cytochrome c
MEGFIMLNRGKVALAALFFAAVGMQNGLSQDKFTYPGCSEVSQTDFNQVLILDKSKDATLDEVIRFAVAKDGSVYFSERGGSVKVLKPTGTVVKIGKVNAYPTTSGLIKTANTINNINNEYGLVGLAIDPNFETNHFMYVTYQTPAGMDSTRLSRFTVNGDAMDMASEKILLSWPTQKDYCCHTGGDIRIDKKGDLWVSVGNNTLNPAGGGDADDSAFVDSRFANSAADDQGHSANTNDLRGKILRIHPTDDGKYTIPAGNLKDYYASLYTTEELNKIRPEIYTMGHRNPFTISVDDVNGLLAWGDIGPDGVGNTEELNLVSHPGFMGWPYFVGAIGNANYSFKMNKDAAAPMNNSVNNSGVKKLPPAQPAIYGYAQAAAITGPIYNYSTAQTSTKKLPAHFNGKWFVTDWKQGGAVSAITLSDAATKVASKTKFFTGSGGGFTHPIQISIGPDGVMYVLDYNNLYNFIGGGGMDTPFSSTPPKLYRLEYKGAACDASTSLADRQASDKFAKSNSLLNIGLAGNRSVSLPVGTRGFSMYDLQGKLAWQANDIGKNVTSLAVPANVGNGLYRVKYEF